MPSPNQDELSFDVVVVGAGTAGLAAAKSAHGAGARVAVVDPMGPLGTLCARGLACMPLSGAPSVLTPRAGSRARRFGALGVGLASPPRFDWTTARARKSELIADFVASVVHTTTTSNAFTLLRGSARFLSGGSVDVGGTRVVAKRFVVASGSAPVVPPIPGLAEVSAATLSSDDVFDLASIPSSVAVLGTGPIAAELGQFLARAGAKVHLVGESDRVAGLPPGEMQDSLTVALERELTLHLSARVERITPRDDAESRGVTLSVRERGGAPRRTGSCSPSGAAPALDGLDLARAEVRLKDGVPIHDDYLRTSNPAIFVAGDAAGAPSLLHTATIQGRTAGHNAAKQALGGNEASLTRAVVEPQLRVVFCDPIVATEGLDPDDAARAGYDVVAVARPWSEQGKARLIDETDGRARLVFDRATRKLLGCQLVGPQADLLIHLASYAMHFGATVEDLLALHHYHPTLAEMIPSLAQRAVSELDGVGCTRGEVAAVVTMQ